MNIYESIRKMDGERATFFWKGGGSLSGTVSVRSTNYPIWVQTDKGEIENVRLANVARVKIHCENDDGLQAEMEAAVAQYLTDAANARLHASQILDELVRLGYAKAISPHYMLMHGSIEVVDLNLKWFVMWISDMPELDNIDLSGLVPTEAAARVDREARINPPAACDTHEEP